MLGQPPSPHRQSLQAGLGPDTEVVVSTEAAPLRAAAARADAVFLWDNLRSLLQDLWPDLRNLRWVHSRAAGLDNLWFSSLRDSAVTVTNSRGLYSRALAEFALGAMLFSAKKFRRMTDNQAAPRWEWMDLEDLSGRTVGILGGGDIGRAVARLAKAFDMMVYATRRRPAGDADTPEIDRWFMAGQFRDMMAASDFVVATLPLTDETRGLVDATALAAMKPTAYFINIGRGATVDEAALIRALEKGRIAGAALDVFTREPLPPDSPFFRLPNLLLSPHSADHTPGWVEAGLELFLDNFRRYRAGQPLCNVVDKRAGY